MINVSTEFKELMKQRTDFQCCAAMTLSDGTEITFSAKDFTMSGNSVTDGAGAEGLPLGAAVCRTVRLSLANPEGALDGYDFYGARIRLYLTLQLSEAEERVELGTFTVTEPETRGETVTVTAGDDMIRTDRPFTTTLAFPATLGALFRDICDACGVAYSTAEFPNSGFAVKEPPGPEYTCRQVLGYIAMLAGGNARVHRDGRMEILSYDPEKEPDHDLADWITLTGDTDDIVITGLEAASADEQGEETTVREGKEGYVLTVDNLLMAGKEAAALASMGERLIGLRMRRFEGEYIAYPLAECMDTVRITDRKGNAFTTVITDAVFAFGGRTTLSNSAVSAVRNSSTYAAPETRARQAARELVAAERTAREAAVEALNGRLARASGMYSTQAPQPDGSVIYYLHDKPALAESSAVMKLTGEVIGFSTDGGKTYPFGFAVTGEMIMSVIRTEGISADWVKVGDKGLLEAFVGRDENDRIVSMLNASADQINIKGNRFVLDSDNFKVSADGTITAKNGKFAGRISSSGTWADGVHALTLEDSRLKIAIGDKLDLFVNQAPGEDEIAGAVLSVYHGDNDNGVLSGDEARRTDIFGGSVFVGVDKNGEAKGEIYCGGIAAKCGKRSIAITGGSDGTYEGIYSPELKKWLLTIDSQKNVRLLGKADAAVKADYVDNVLPLSGGTLTGPLNVGGKLQFRTDGEGGNIDIRPPDKYTNYWEVDAYNGDLRFIDFNNGGVDGIPLVLSGDPNKTVLRGTANKVSNALTFTGGVTGTWNGSAAKTVNIPTTLPANGGTSASCSGNAATATTADKVKNALTFTGGVTGTWNGSAAKTVAVPFVQAGSVHITPSAANTPTAAKVTFPKAFANTPFVCISAFTTVPGTTVKGVAISDITARGFKAYLTRTNTTDTALHWIAVDL